MSEELRDHLVAAHAAVFDGLLEATGALDEAAWATPTGCPGWDVHDQLAHTVGVERRMLGDPPPTVELPDLPHVRGEFGRTIEVDVEARRGVPGAELRTEAKATFARRIGALRALDPARLREPLDGPAGMQMRGSQMLRTRVFDLTCHEQDIRRALGRLDGLAGPHLPIAIEQVLRAWARVLPDRLRDGGRLAVLVQGHEPVAIALPGGELLRGAAATQDQTATLRLDPAALLALGGGRSDAPGPDGLHVDGDRDLVDKVLRAATITP